MAKIKQGGLFTSQTSSLSNYDQASRPCTACAPHAHRTHTACAPHAHRLRTASTHLPEQEIVRMEMAAAKPPPKKGGAKGGAKDEPPKPVNLELNTKRGSLSSQEYGVAMQC